MKDTNLSRIHRSSGLKGVNPPSRRLAANKPYLPILYKMIETPHGIGPTADAGHHGVWKPALSGKSGQIPAVLVQCKGLEIPDDHGKWMRPHHGAKAIMSVTDPGCPFPHCLRHGIFQRCRPGFHCDHLRSQKPHAVDIQRLADSVLLSHKDNTLHPQKRRRRRARHAVLAGARLGDQPRLAHLLCKERLPQDVIDLVGAGVI